MTKNIYERIKSIGKRITVNKEQADWEQIFKTFEIKKKWFSYQDLKAQTPG